MSTTVATQGTKTTWQIDPSHTTIEFAAKHMMFTTVKGRFTGVEGLIVADEADPAASSVRVTIDAASLDSRDERRDGHLRSADFLDVENHPRITFTSTRVEPVAADRLKVHGDLTIRGITRPVILDTTYHGTGATPFGSTVAGFTAETQINRKDFGLTWNVALETGGVLVGETVKISLEVQASRQ
jgi:polyisoprenoid-binding protein YceI